jgi:hypothetical protein
MASDRETTINSRIYEISVASIDIKCEKSRQYVRLSRARVNQTRLQTDLRGGEEGRKRKKEKKWTFSIYKSIEEKKKRKKGV